MDDEPKKKSLGKAMILTGSAVTIIALFTGLSDLSEAWDKAHTTEVELNQAIVSMAHPVSADELQHLKDALSSSETKSHCRWLRSERRAIESAIHSRRADGVNQNYIRDLERDLEDLEDRYKTMQCAVVLNKK